MEIEQTTGQPVTDLAATSVVASKPAGALALRCGPVLEASGPAWTRFGSSRAASHPDGAHPDSAMRPRGPLAASTAFVASLVMAVCVLLAGAATAQVDPPPDTGGGVPGLEFNIEGDIVTMGLNENAGIPLVEFINLARNITGKVFVYNEAELAQNGPNQTINFVGSVRLPREEWFAFFQTMLYIKNFGCVVRETGGSEIVQIVSMQGTNRSEIQGNARYVSPENIEQFRSQTGVTILTSIPFKFVKANAAVTTLRPFFTVAGTAAPLQFGTVGNDRALLIQGFGPQVYAAYRLLDLVDVAPEIPDHETKVVELNYATAEEIEPIITKVLEDRARRIQQSGAGGNELAAGQGSQVTISGLPSQRSMLISGAPDTVLEALELVAKLDAPLETSDGFIHTIQLKNVLADELQDTLRNFLTEDQRAEQQAQSASAGSVAQRRPRPTVIVAHPESNSLLVSATQSNFQQIKRMIDDLDRRQPQVMIEAALVELSTNQLDTLGVEIGLLDIANDDFTRPFGFSSFGISNFEDTDDDNLPDTRLPDFDNPLQGITGGILSSDDFAIPILVNALQQDDQANILSLPSVVVNNHETAMVSSKEVRPTTTTNQGNTTTQTGAGPEQEAGIELEISPSISNDDYLRLNITLRVSRFLTTADPNAVTGGPRTEREVRTQITIPNGHTMILGGVIEDSESHSDSGIPILKDIPLLGILFRRSTDQEVKTNLYFFVTPTILDDDEFADLAELTQRKKLEASQYIGHRRLQIVDRNWIGGRTLEDSEATIDDIDRLGNFDTPKYNRPTTPPSLDRLPVEKLNEPNGGPSAPNENR